MEQEGYGPRFQMADGFSATDNVNYQVSRVWEESNMGRQKTSEGRTVCHNIWRML
jgi:hypothetical protein